MKGRKTSSHRLYLALALILASLLVYAYASYAPYPFNPFGLIPPFEGLNSGIEGVEVYGRFYRIDQGLPSGYRFLANDPHTIILEKDTSPFYGVAQVRVEVGEPREVNEWFTQPQKVHYWVKVDESEFVEVEGEVVEYELHVTVSAINVFGVDEWFSGEKIWISLTSLTWNRAYQKQGADYGQAWEAPIAAVIESFELRDGGEHYKVEPSLAGRWITLYESPSQVGTVSDLGVSLGRDLNSTLAGDPAPDTRIKRTAYFALTLADFGVTDHLVQMNAPVADYVIKVYALRIGKFTYTNPDNTPWGQRQPEQDWLDQFIEFMSKTFGIPAAIIGWGIVGVILFLLFMLAMIVVVAVAVRLGVGVKGGGRT